MTIFRLATTVCVPRRLEEVFAVHADAANLQAITPLWLDFRILTPQPFAVREGTTIDYRLRWHGVPIRWRSVIVDGDPPRAFEDRQVRGPHQLWEHRHAFESCGT